MASGMVRRGADALSGPGQRCLAAGSSSCSTAGANIYASRSARVPVRRKDTTGKVGQGRARARPGAAARSSGSTTCALRRSSVRATKSSFTQLRLHDGVAVHSFPALAPKQVPHAVMNTWDETTYRSFTPAKVFRALRNALQLTSG
jgi:hypothetical protein